MSFRFPDSKFLPDIGEYLGDRLRSTGGYIIQALLNTGDSFVPLVAEPAKRLHDYLVAGSISPCGKFLLNEGLQFRWKLDLHVIYSCV
jgi:hypothetical protein